MMQSDFNLTMYQEDLKSTSLNFGGNKSYCMFDGAETLVMCSSFDAYSSLKNERLFLLTPLMIERWIYKEGIPYIETFDPENQLYSFEKYSGI